MFSLQAALTTRRACRKAAVRHDVFQERSYLKNGIELMKVVSMKFVSGLAMDKECQCFIGIAANKNSDHLTISELVSCVEHIAVAMKKEISAKFILAESCRLTCVRKVKPGSDVRIDFMMTSDGIDASFHQAEGKCAEVRADFAKIVYE